MTDTQRIEALSELMSEVIHCLNMKQWDIEEPTDAYLCEVQADDHYDNMLTILHSDTEANV